MVYAPISGIFTPTYPMAFLMKHPILNFALLALMTAGCSDTTQPAPGAAAGPGSTEEYVEARRIPPSELPRALPVSMAEGQPYRGGMVRPNGRALEVLDAAGRVIEANDDMIRFADDNENCPSDGFNRIVVKGDYFTLEQQTCSGMLFINEYVTFKADADGQIYLHKFGIVKTDRSDPERNIPERTLTGADFGKLRLRDTDIDRLYTMFSAEAAMTPSADPDTMTAP